jgi:hypothetical protein
MLCSATSSFSNLFPISGTVEATVKLLGAGAFAFHSTLEWVFVGDRCGTLLAWDVSVPSRPNMIGMWVYIFTIKQVGYSACTPTEFVTFYQKKIGEKKILSKYLDLFTETQYSS